MSRCRLPLPKPFRKSRSRIEEWDVVELKHDVGKWTAGTRGEVLTEELGLKVVTVSDDLGRLLAVIALPEEELELIERRQDGYC
jgi:hypothetical protein